MCISPLEGYRARDVNPSGKRSIVFSSGAGYKDLPVSVPCGQCIECRLERSRQWAMRCMHEASLHEDNSYVTLTYDDAHLPEHGTLVKSDLSKFMRRLRKRYRDTRIRFFGAGEYGDRFGRPYYHVLLFGFDFADKISYGSENGYPLWRSPALESLWRVGQSVIGCVTFESAAYVARYCVKKVTGVDASKAYEIAYSDTGEIHELASEFGLMSRRPGIGREWYDRYKCEVFNADSVVVRGVEVKPPRYYSGLFELSNPEDMAAIKRARRRKVRSGDQSHERLEARRAVMEARVNLKARRLL